MQSAKTSSGNRAIERFVVAVIGGLILVAVGGAILTTVLGLQTQGERDKETRRDQVTGAAIIDLVRTQKQIQLDVVQVQQFLTDVSATRGQNGLDTGWAEAEENAQAFHKDVARARVLAGQLGSTRLAGALNTAEQAFAPYYETGQRMAHAYVDGGPAAGNALMPQFDASAEALTRSVAATDAAVASVLKASDDENDLVETQLAIRQKHGLEIAAAVALMTAVAGGAIMVMVRRRVLRPLGVLANYMQTLSAGDYEPQVPIAAGRDELGLMAGSIAVFRESAIERREAREAREAERLDAERAKAERDAERQAADAERREVVSVLADGLHRLSEGDLAHRIVTPVSAEYQALRDDFNGAAEKLQTAMSRIGAASSAVGVSASEIAKAADNLSQRTERQAASLEQTAAALDQITATVRQTANHTAQARDMISESRSEAEATQAVLATTLTAVSEIEARASPKRARRAIIANAPSVVIWCSLVALEIIGRLRSPPERCMLREHVQSVQ